MYILNLLPAVIKLPQQISNQLPLDSCKRIISVRVTITFTIKIEQQINKRQLAKQELNSLNDIIEHN